MAIKRTVNGEAVKALREALGVSQKALAMRVGVSTSTLNHTENGNRPVSAEVLRRLADELRVPLGAISMPVVTNVATEEEAA